MDSNTVRINGKQFDVHPYDDTSSLVARYSLRERGTVPGFFSIKTSKSLMKKGLKLRVRDIRVELDELLMTDLLDPIILYRLEVTFPRFSRISDLINVWLQVKYSTQGALKSDLEGLIPTLRELDPKFSSHGIILKNYEDFKARLKKIRKRTKKDLLQWDRHMESLSKLPPTEALPFVTRRASISMNLQIRDVSILEVFDAFEVSPQIPLIILQLRGRTLFKVFAKFIPPKKWVAADLPRDGLHFKILGDQNEFYAGYLSEKHYLEFDYRLGSGFGEDQITELVLSSLGTRVGRIKISQKEEAAVGGSFEVKLSFNKAIMADLIALDDIASEVLLLKELSKSATEKKNFTFSYRLWNGRTVSAIITVHKKGRVFWTRVTLRKASNLQEIKMMEFIFQRIATLYLKKKGRISRAYYKILSHGKVKGKEIVSKYDSEVEKVPTESKTPTTRLSKLIQERPKLFIKGEYSTLCQKDRQPILLKGKEELDARLGKLKKKKEMHLNFPPGSEDYYICLPGNESYPGLRLNLMANKEEYPYVPCCFLIPRDKKNQEILDIWDDKVALREKALGIEPFSETVQGYIMNSEKLLAQGRFGRLPLYLQEIALMAGYKGKKNVLRMGVPESPSSFLHCLERALNPSYLEMGSNEREEHVQKVRERISKYPNFAVGKQELFDHTDQEIREILRNPQVYLAPRLFVSLVSKYYQATIFLYSQNSRYPDGSILIPSHTQAYLLPQIDIERSTVLVLEKSRNGKMSQCEVLASGTDKIKLTVDFGGDPLAKAAKDVLYESNQVSAVKPEISRSHPVNLSPYVKISPKSKLLTGVDSQFVDIYGKTRALNYGGVTLITSPLPPFDLPIKNPQIAEEDDLKDFIQRANFKIIFQDQGVIPGVWVEPESSQEIYLGYIPANLTKAISGVPVAPETRIRPLSTEDPSESVLSQMRKSRKMAHLLQEYTLFEYSHTQSTDIFVVDPDHTFQPREVYRLTRDNSMYQGGKLVVPSEDLAQRLKYYLKTQLLNDRQGVMSYRRRTFSREAYTELSDFRHRRNQLVFLNSLGILKWRVDIRSQLSSHVIQNQESPEFISPYFYRNPNIDNGKNKVK